MDILAPTFTRPTLPVATSDWTFASLTTKRVPWAVSRTSCRMSGTGRSERGPGTVRRDKFSSSKRRPESYARVSENNYCHVSVVTDIPRVVV
jgi:hypothetical protein